MFLYIPNFDLFIFCIVVIITGILGIGVFLNDRKNISNQSFAFFTFFSIIWTIINFLSYRPSMFQWEIWIIRGVLATSIWAFFFFFKLCYVFPNKNFIRTKFYKTLLAITSISSLFFLSPYTISETPLFFHTAKWFNKIYVLPGMIIYGLLVIGLMAGGIYLLFKKNSQADAKQKQQYKIILGGCLVSFILLLLANFVAPVFFNNIKFIPWAATFQIPLLLGFGYAIAQHQLFDIKIVVTKILIAILFTVMIWQVIFSFANFNLSYNLFFITLISITCYLLLKNIRKEREHLEKISKFNATLNGTISQIINSIDDPILIVNKRMNLIAVNKGAKKTFQQNNDDYPVSLNDFCRTKINRSLPIIIKDFFEENKESAETEILFPENAKVKIILSPFSQDDPKDSVLMIIKKINY